MTPLKRLLTAGILCILGSISIAQPGPTWIPSLEFLASKANLIVRGKVISVEPVLRDYQIYRVAMSVDETFKGPSMTSVKFVAHISLAGSEQPSIFTGKNVIAFLNDDEPLDTHTPLLGKLPDKYSIGFPGGESAILELDPRAGIQVMTMGMEPLSNPETILTLTREAAKVAPAAKSWNVPLPRNNSDLPKRTPSTGMGTIMEVPVDSRLEHLAKSWAASPLPELRALGVQGLGLFKSATNIAIVQSALNDNTVRIYDLGRDREFPVRYIREAAKDVLDNWGIPWEPVNPASAKASREMIRVPAGEFIAGGSPGAEDAGQAHKVQLDEYWIGKTPVTVAQFRAFCNATKYVYDWAGNRPSHGYKDDHPMVSVDWNDAKAFCAWVGGSLPTEDQWEKAARGTDGRRFPWGDTWDSSRAHVWVNTFTTWRTTAPVGSYPTGASPYGCLDMIGNVMQWCDGGSPTHRPARGAGFQTDSNDLRFIQPAGRGIMYGDGRIYTQGFRVAGKKRLQLP